MHFNPTEARDGVPDSAAWRPSCSGGSRSHTDVRKRAAILTFAAAVVIAAAIAVIWRFHETTGKPASQRAAAPLSAPRAMPAAPRAIAPAAPPHFRTGERIGEIAIPRLKVRVPVYEGDDERILAIGAGHVPGTALPGSPGNICIAAHRDRFFRQLRFIRPDDEIVLYTKQGPLRYLVKTTVIVPPSRVDELLPGPRRDLTLVTCYPFYYVGHAPKRFIVHATREPVEQETAVRPSLHG